MKELRVCFVGIGSIAKRHIKNLRTICLDNGVELVIDAIRRNVCSNDDIQPLGIHKIMTSPEEIGREYDAVFITNPTEYHVDTLNRMHRYSNHFFIEKPISSVSQLNAIEKFKRRAGAVYYVACPLRYHAVIQYVRDHIDLNTVISVRSISSSYLPDWRPGTDYRNTYSAHKALGGGVSIDLIHEWDYLTYLFGSPVAVKSFIGKKSNLMIDSDDYAVYIAEYPNMIAELHLDYFGRKTIREIQLFTDEDTIIGDLAAHKITYLKSGRIIDLNEERDDYQKRELKFFLNLINRKDGYEEISHAVNVLKLTQGELS